MSIPSDEWLVVIDRQKVFAESDWSDWACPAGSFHTTGAPLPVIADACAASSPENHQRALDTMALFTPLITITDSAAVLG
ncbi:hypothetical protein [Bifidobacterium callitrichidarum]|uniref:Isochorismatase n=1 Tax=Bifidobacterium callitrichidarum TaxID=2052941 RepID=A0A2U2N3Y4_9BIFI|nr:hypothetical protein [Bifidobacterium callitrichidarum]PWG63802.1 hypothetical protein DF196_10165 [Bifidobacterium callitrichidarum]